MEPKELFFEFSKKQAIYVSCAAMIDISCLKSRLLMKLSKLERDKSIILYEHEADCLVNLLKMNIRELQGQLGEPTLNAMREAIAILQKRENNG